MAVDSSGRPARDARSSTNIIMMLCGGGDEELLLYYYSAARRVCLSTYISYFVIN